MTMKTLKGMTTIFCRTLTIIMALSPVFCCGQLNFSNTPLTNEFTQQPLSSDTTKCVVLIHGWNPSGAANCYDINNGFEFYNLLNNLKSELQYTGWGIIAYHWEKDADTGAI